MKTYAIRFNGKVLVNDAALSEYQANKRMEQYQKKLQYYVNYGSPEGKEKAKAELATLEIFEEPEVQTLEEAKCRMAVIIRSRQHFIDDVVKLRANLESANKGWHERYLEVVKSFNESVPDKEFFITQAGEFILTKDHILYIKEGMKLASVDELVMDLMEQGWMGGDLHSLDKIVQTMIDGTYDPKQFGGAFLSFADYP